VTAPSLSAFPQALVGGGVGQIGILVPDLDGALRAYGAFGTIESWSIYTYGPPTVPSLRYRDGPGRFSVRIALGGRAPQIELMQPIEGPSLYDEWIAERGYGLHHLGFFVPSLDVAVAAMTDAGFAVLQRGSGYGLDGDGGFAYFDTADLASVILEAIEVPTRRRTPEATWPGRPAG
jgi:catechol 2,3-dioxygenase-like lactoylglutathione lyase family enzyme